MANPATYSDHQIHSNQTPGRAQPGTDLKWPASAIWRPGEPAVRHITIADVFDALARGFDDFRAMPSHAIFLCLVYPIAGVIVYRMLFGYEMLPLIYPMTAGFALLGPVAAIGLYELSRRREQGLDVSVSRALEVLRAPSIGTIARLGLVLAAIFFAWLYAAQVIYTQIFGSAVPLSLGGFIDQVTTTSGGHQLFVVGNIVGFLFAALVLVISVVSFPMLVDRSDVSAATAVRTSIRASLQNPVPVALWGVIVAAALLVGSLPLFVGLAVVLPVLGHATWHLYRKLVER